MVVITFVDRTDGPIFKKIRVVLSKDWPLQINNMIVQKAKDLPKVFHRLGIKDWRVETITPQNFAERTVLGTAHAVASELVFKGYEGVEVNLEKFRVSLTFMGFDAQVYIVHCTQHGFVEAEGVEIPSEVKSLFLDYLEEFS